MIVAYQGEPGAFSEAAVRHLFGAAARPLGCASFAEVRAEVLDGRAEAGVLPVENSVAGPVATAHAVLAEGGLVVRGEVSLRVRQCLLAPPGAALDTLERVLSHPVALAQCGRFLARHPHLRPVPVHDTAGAARLVAAGGDARAAALASREAAAIYGLAVLAEGVEDDPANTTRFVAVVRADGGAGDRTG
jgi:prephenate dehydratase